MNYEFKISKLIFEIVKQSFIQISWNLEKLNLFKTTEYNEYKIVI